MPAIRPERIETFPNGEVGIVWEDGREDVHSARDLRIACPCAGCVDEMTGRRTLDPGRVPTTFRALGWEEVGHYAVHFRWSDAHGSGIYSYELLRRLGSR